MEVVLEWITGLPRCVVLPLTLQGVRHDVVCRDIDAAVRKHVSSSSNILRAEDAMVINDYQHPGYDPTRPMEYTSLNYTVYSNEGHSESLRNRDRIEARWAELAAERS